jgi:hypothetical protein
MKVRQKKAEIHQWLAVCLFRKLKNTDQDEFVDGGGNLDGAASLSGEPSNIAILKNWLNSVKRHNDFDKFLSLAIQEFVPDPLEVGNSGKTRGSMRIDFRGYDGDRNEISSE